MPLDPIPHISAQKNEELCCIRHRLKKKFVCKVNSFALNGKSLHLKHVYIFGLPLRLSVNYYYKQVISAQSQ